MDKSFGKDDMASLLGGAGEVGAGSGRLMDPTNSRRATRTLNRSSNTDFSSMSAAETAAMLIRKSTGQETSEISARYRTNRTLAHHSLAHELASELGSIENSRIGVREQASDQDSDSDNSFTEQTSSRKPRERYNSRVLQRECTKIENESRRIRAYDSSSDDDGQSFNGTLNRQRKRSRSESSSSSDGEERVRRGRRQRIYSAAARKPEELLLLDQKDNDEITTLESKRCPNLEIVIPSKLKNARSKSQQGDLIGGDHSPCVHSCNGPSNNSSSPSSGSSESSSSESSSSESSSSEDEEHVLTKPVFIRKDKRKYLSVEEEEWKRDEARKTEERARREKRKIESRLIVAKQLVTPGFTDSSNFESDDEMIGAANVQPSDDDAIGNHAAKDGWELREIARLLHVMDQLRQIADEDRFHQRRRQMTDEECLREDKTTGRYRAPGSARSEQQNSNAQQRYFHRGAYYMNTDEWDETDIRHKAAEYAQTATGDDKIDKTQLPDVMKVKKFGFSRQNTKYKGLTSEDTSDRTFNMLPLVQKKT